jgi:hypothetical protein
VSLWERYMFAMQEATSSHRERALVAEVEQFLMGHERTEDGSSDGGSGTTEPDGHPED